MKCCEQVFKEWHYYPCTRNGVVERNGKWYCRQHDPEAVAARRRAQQAAWDQERAQRARAQAIAEAKERVVEIATAWNEQEAKGHTVCAKSLLGQLKDAVDALKELEK